MLDEVRVHLSGEMLRCDATNGNRMPFENCAGCSAVFDWMDREMNIRKLFKANCGPGARYLGHEMRQRGEHNTVAIQFEMVPEGRQFDLDWVVRGDGDEGLRVAVLKIAETAQNIREHVKPDGRPAVMNGR